MRIYRPNPAVIVRAFEILGVEKPVFDIEANRYITRLRLEDGVELIPTSEQLARIKPVPGDYVVMQEDGYTYLNPKAVFERKYVPVEVPGQKPS